MCEWHQVITRSDVDFLKNEYCDFHDCCITGVNYVTGSFVDENGTMKNGTEQDRTLNVLFNSQSANRTLELCFSGVRSFGIVGWQEGCFCDIHGCCLKVEDSLIVWSDAECFSPDLPYNPYNPGCSYIIASSLKWNLK